MMQIYKQALSRELSVAFSDTRGDRPIDKDKTSDCAVIPVGFPDNARVHIFAFALMRNRQ